MDELYNAENLDRLLRELGHYDAKLVAVSKKHPAEAVQAVYNHGHKIFGEPCTGIGCQATSITKRYRMASNWSLTNQ